MFNTHISDEDVYVFLLKSKVSIFLLKKRTSWKYFFLQFLRLVLYKRNSMKKLCIDRQKSFSITSRLTPQLRNRYQPEVLSTYVLFSLLQNWNAGNAWHCKFKTLKLYRSFGRTTMRLIRIEVGNLTHSSQRSDIFT